MTRNSGPVGRMAGILVRSVLRGAPTILLVVVASFFLLKLAPGDAIDVIAADAGSATRESMAQLRRQYGLDLSVFGQFQLYVGRLAHFDLGISPRYGLPVVDLIAERLPASLALMGLAMTIAVLSGVTIGCIAASFAGRWPDRVLSTVVLIFYSVPGFWICLMLIALFSAKLGWLPAGGIETIGADLSGWSRWIDRCWHMLLPATGLSLLFTAIYARLTRAAMIDVRDQDFVRTARAKGLSNRQVILRHMLPNALLPVTAMMGVHIGTLLSGSVVVETIFNLPGIGRLAFEAVLQRDFNILIALLIFTSILVIAGNILVDLLQAWLDPRIDARR